MKRQIKLTVLLILGLFTGGIFSNSGLADQKSEGKPSKAETVEKAAPSDQVAQILGHYFVIRNLLAQDKTEGMSQEAKEMSQSLDQLITALQAMKSASDSLRTEELKRAREDFGPLSEAVMSYVKQFGFSGKAYGFYCDMVKKSWLQEHDQIGNPYYGSRMFKCGKMTGKIENGKYAEK